MINTLKPLSKAKKKWKQKLLFLEMHVTKKSSPGQPGIYFELNWIEFSLNFLNKVYI